MEKTATKFTRLYHSPIGKKIVTGVTGLGLVLFVGAHMTGNLSYFSSDPNAYNAYSHFLTQELGALFYLIEIGLLLFFVYHITLGVNIYLGKRRARAVEYSVYQTAGQPSMQSSSSKSMIITGVLLGIFLVFHLLSFKYGPGVSEGYTVMVDGVEMRDMKLLLVEKFQSPLYTFGYVAIMVLLGVHLRHGFWSAFQSLGAMKPRWSPIVYTIGGVIAVLVTIGFVVLPLWIFFGL